MDVVDDSSRSGGTRPAQFKDAFIYYQSMNNCTGEVNFFAQGVSDFYFAQNGTLKAARFQANIPYFDWNTGTEKLAFLLLNWTGTGTLLTSKDRAKTTEAGYITFRKVNGSGRTASVTAVLNIDGRSIFTQQAGNGLLSTLKSSEMIILKP